MIVDDMIVGCGSEHNKTTNVKEENPVDIHNEIQTKSILYREHTIDDAINKMATYLFEMFKSDNSLVVISILDGSVKFASALIKHFPHIPMSMNFLKVSSYGDNLESGELYFRPSDLSHIKNSDRVLIIDDILDTGKTFDTIKNHIQTNYAPKVIMGCVLVSKQNRCDVVSCFKYYGPGFLVGYGMDYKGYGRNLNDIRIISRP